MLLKNPGEVYKQLGNQYRFGEPIEPKKEPEQTAKKQKPQAEIEKSEPNATKPEAQSPIEPFKGKNIHLSCGAKCGIPLKNYNGDESGSNEG